MQKHYRCRGFVNGQAVTIRLDAESELDAINKFHQQFITEGHDASKVERVAVKEKAPPKSARLRFGKDPNAPVEPDPVEYPGDSADAPTPKASKRASGKRSRK